MKQRIPLALHEHSTGQKPVDLEQLVKLASLEHEDADKLNTLLVSMARSSELMTCIVIKKGEKRELFWGNGRPNAFRHPWRAYVNLPPQAGRSQEQSQRR